jgi:hypothetical protein
MEDKYLNRSRSIFFYTVNFWCELSWYAESTTSYGIITSFLLNRDRLEDRYKVPMTDKCFGVCMYS